MCSKLFHKIESGKRKNMLRLCVAIGVDGGKYKILAHGCRRGMVSLLGSRCIRKNMFHSKITSPCIVPVVDFRSRIQSANNQKNKVFAHEINTGDHILWYGTRYIVMSKHLIYSPDNELDTVTHIRLELMQAKDLHLPWYVLTGKQSWFRIQQFKAQDKILRVNFASGVFLSK
jgi:hypothetical protein